MTKIEVTFLGTTAAVPTKHRNQASVHLCYRSENEFNYLFDCGEGTQRQMLLAGINFMRINEIFISHWHADHFIGLVGLMETMSLEGREKPLVIYGPEAEKFVDIIETLGYSTKDFPIKARNVEFEGSEIETILETAEFSIKATPMKHGIPAVAYSLEEKDRVNLDKAKIEQLGLPPKGPMYGVLKEKGKATIKGKEVTLEQIARVEKGKKVVYSGDTLPNRNMAAFARNATLLIHDSTFLEEDREHGHKHASVQDVLKLGKEAGVKEIVLTHISRRYQNPDDIKDKIKDHPHVKLAKDFMKVVLD